MSSMSRAWAKLEALPEGVGGEVVGGEVVVLPRPAAPHVEVASRIGRAVGGPFDDGLGGPGGWVILAEPGVAFADEIRVPDVAGWRVERYEFPLERGPFVVVPDWVCEVLSESNAFRDRTEKLPLYARSGVRHVWLVDPLAFSIEVYRLDGESYRYVQAIMGAGRHALEPFEAVEVDVGLLWRGRFAGEVKP